ncbi:MAG TPA: lantibiotic dehydratase [Jatrophihabitans sp.]|nr:lantibiotic dehydratase [Jatrophihabitans sp.]
MQTEQQTHLIPLADGWASWRDVVLRGAGFPADTVRMLTDPELAVAADAAVHDPDRQPGYLAEYRSATGRLSAAITELARSPRFREAVTWQNPKLVKLCLDKVAAGEPRNVRGRNHEQTVASYLQRYSMKNDTVSFVGPVGWARWAETGPALDVRIGAGLLARRTVYFEAWAIDAVAGALSTDPELRPWLVPRLYSAHRLDGATLRVPGRPPVALTGCEQALLALVDGARTVRDIAAELARSDHAELGDPATLLPALDALVARSLLRLDLVGGIETWPERTLLAKLARIPDRPVRERTVGVVQDLIAARDRVGACAGDDVALEAALAELADCFRTITGLAGERRPGETYAGRALVYEDTVRDTRVGLGPELRAELARPLCLLLDSARWLVAEIGCEYERFFLGLYQRRAGQLGSSTVPLPSILSLATPQLFYNARGLPELIRRVVAEFQRRWAAILRIPPDARDIRLRSEDLREQVAQLFPARPVPWATAIHHSPDIMLAAPDAGAVGRGEHLFVLGELHVSFNTMESRLFVQQHDDPASLLAAAESDLGEQRICAIAPRHGHAVTSRTAPPSALMSPRYTYWTMYPESATPPGPIMPAADLFVHRDGDRLIVRSGSGDFKAPLCTVLGEQLSGVTVNAFKPLPRSSYSPRVSIDRLVISRQSWTFRAADVAWAAVRDEPERFLEARSWRLRHCLPERAFYTVPVEDKPTFVDFGSLAYVNILAKAIRRSAAEPDGSITLTEMLPDQSQLWLRDGDGRRYTSELRLLAVDRRATVA